ncbi:prolactin-like [Arapaima gigas]
MYKREQNTASPGPRSTGCRRRKRQKQPYPTQAAPTPPHVVTANNGVRLRSRRKSDEMAQGAWNIPRVTVDVCGHVDQGGLQSADVQGSQTAQMGPADVQSEEIDVHHDPVRQGADDEYKLTRTSPVSPAQPLPPCAHLMKELAGDVGQTRLLTLGCLPSNPAAEDVEQRGAAEAPRMSGNMKPGSVFVLLLVCSDLHALVESAPICAHGHSSCHPPTLPDLFDRVIQHSARMHGLSSDLHSEFERYFVPSKNQIGRINRKCHTSYILTPNGKENAQRLAREELTEVILKLLAAWRNPLSQFHRSMARHEDFTSISGNKALEMSDMVHQLKNGVEKVAEKMQLLGMISNSLTGLSSTEALAPHAPSGETHPMSDYELLYCFRRDSNKVQNYLKILKCRIVPEHGC